MAVSWNARQMSLVAQADFADECAQLADVGFPFVEQARVLDVGCFDGEATVARFAPFSNVSEVVGIDPLPDAVLAARERAHDGRFSFRCASLDEYEGAPGSFDLVCFYHSLQHVPDAAAAAARAFELLRPGGWVVAKTADDEAKLSYPDPDHLMRRVMALYDQRMRSQIPHTRHTDRHNGQKCATILGRAGFSDVRVRVRTASTAGLDEQARAALFERCTYFRRGSHVACESLRAEMADLLEQWRLLFKRDDYFFLTSTFYVAGRKPGAAPRASGLLREERQDGLTVRAMGKEDLCAVVEIEMSSFDDPWSPTALLAELDHNPRACYAVALDGGAVAGYVGWWDLPEQGVASITKIAVSRTARRCGVGRALMAYAARCARRAGEVAAQLEVRASNAAARAFYQRMGFQEVGVRTGYYVEPPTAGGSASGSVDDAVIMALSL
ncbi:MULTISPECIES: ribosomal protein S18-alanine N-acetyltransferase [unclassified Adlercreutzia]|uniref:ribosomal protein S18-alanine N-acetyltransferase n=1 Tax=unclassified Adlercreutzia TaxID=2636013 RepID=UPI0013EC78C9|nr:MULTISPECIES: ribosomal protein S18-alanine N-acetyltransferase [unclassified Adlercreutzia]